MGCTKLADKISSNYYRYILYFFLENFDRSKMELKVLMKIFEHELGKVKKTKDNC